MLYKFKSKAAGDLIMLEANGRQVLQIIGKELSASGIILPDQMAAAVVTLQNAVEKQEASQREAIEIAQTRGDPLPEFPALSLRKRVWPLIDMLKRCEHEGAAITWGSIGLR
jgi:hypothetical protein